HARRAADALRVGHGDALVGEVHHVDALVADGGADVAGDALFLLGKNAEAAEARVDVHQRRQRAEEAAPHAAGEVEVETVADRAGEEEVDEPGIVEDRYFALEPV